MACTIFYFVYLDIVLEKLYCLHHHTTPYNNENFERTLQNLFIIFTFGFCATSTSSSISKIFPFTDNKIPKQNGKSHQGCRDQKFGDNHLSSLDVESLLRNLALWSQNALLSKNSDRIFHKNNLWIHFERHNKNRQSSSLFKFFLQCKFLQNPIGRSLN